MFLQILSTVIRVILVFSVLFVAFGLTFYIMLSKSVSWVTGVNIFNGSKSLRLPHAVGGLFTGEKSKLLLYDLNMTVVGQLPQQRLGCFELQ